MLSVSCELSTSERIQNEEEISEIDPHGQQNPQSGGGGHVPERRGEVTERGKSERRKMTETKVFTLEDLKKHTTQDDCWLLLFGKVRPSRRDDESFCTPATGVSPKRTTRS